MASNHCILGGELLPCTCAQLCVKGGERLPCTCLGNTQFSPQQRIGYQKVFSHSDQLQYLLNSQRAYEQFMGPPEQYWRPLWNEALPRTCVRVFTGGIRSQDLLKRIGKIDRNDFGIKKGPSVMEMRGHFKDIARDIKGAPYLIFIFQNSIEDKASLIFDEIAKDLQELSVHIYGHDFVKCMLRPHGPLCYEKMVKLLKEVSVLTITTHKYGNRVIQKAISVLPVCLKLKILPSLKGSILMLSRETFGSFVIERILEHVPMDFLDFLFKELQQIRFC